MASWIEKTEQWKDRVDKLTANLRYDDANDDFKERFNALITMFKGQSDALDSIAQQGFFKTITESFMYAMETFLQMLLNLRTYLGKLEDEKKQSERKQVLGDEIRETKKTIIKDAYGFIRAFDNALQGYLNSDRQFLEFPSHHIALYDLPVKLGTVYVRFIETVVKSFNDTDRKMAFLLSPEPLNQEGITIKNLLQGYDIEMKEQMQDKNSAALQTCVIAVPAELLFKPQQIMLILTHEIAHYTNRAIRTHDGQRNELFLNVALDESNDRLYNAVREECKGANNKWLDVVLKNWVDKTVVDIKGLITSALQSDQYRHSDWIWDKDETLINMCEAYERIISAIFCFSNLYDDLIEIVPSIEEKLAQNAERFEKANKENVKMIYYLFKECCADVRMIKLLDIDYKTYVSLICDFKRKNADKETMLLWREYFVYKTVYNNEAALADYGICEDKNALLSENSREEIINYLKEVSKKTASDDNDARKMYKELCVNDGGFQPNKLIDYMG